MNCTVESAKRFNVFLNALPNRVTLYTEFLPVKYRGSSIILLGVIQRIFILLPTFYIIEIIKYAIFSLLIDTDKPKLN